MGEQWQALTRYLQENKNKVLIFIGYNLLFISFLLVFMTLSQKESREIPEENPTIENILAEKRSIETSTVIESLPPEPELIYVDVKGAVHTPGMYQFDSGARVQDVITEAGGFLKDADVNLVNLALKLEDQMLVYIPKVGEEAPEVASPTQDKQSSADTEKVNLNTADITELQTLNGIGEKKAQLILDYREENGSFQQIEDIQNVSGIGEKSFESLKDYLIVE